MRLATMPLTPFSFVFAAFTSLFILVGGQICLAASDCDVAVMNVKSVVIEDGKIIVTAEANVGMVIITPDGEAKGKSVQFTGRESVWIQMKADEATFTVLPPRGEVEDEFWTDMSRAAAQALKEGKPIGRIGFYRPEITIKKNRIHAVTGRGYIYPKRK